MKKVFLFTLNVFFFIADLHATNQFIQPMSGVGIYTMDGTVLGIYPIP
jgi:hypothetical protein